VYVRRTFFVCPLRPPPHLVFLQFDMCPDAKIVVILVSSTTGDGEQPEKAAKMWRKLHQRNLPADHLDKVRFAYLGLGDSNYSQFCHGPKRMRKRMMEMGATEFYEPGWADDGTGLVATNMSGAGGGGKHK
jgi:sulfite reductase alpha subunit-like flavoprotein